MRRLGFGLFFVGHDAGTGRGFGAGRESSPMSARFPGSLLCPAATSVTELFSRSKRSTPRAASPAENRSAAL